MTLWILLVALVMGLSVFFIYQWLATSSAVRSMTVVERATAEVADARRRRDHQTLYSRFDSAMVQLGLNERSILPFAAWLMLDLVIVVTLLMLGVGGVVGIVASVPVSALLVLWLLATYNARRKRTVNRQMIQLLQLIAGQLEAGNGPMAALETVLGSMSDPLHTELSGALAESGVTPDIVTAFQLLGQRFPSKSLALVTSAFEINREEGGAISPAIRQAADTMARDQELNEETLAEISQTKSEFWVIVGIISGIVVAMFLNESGASTNPYANPGAIVVLTLGLANFAWGIYRGLRIFAKARGSV